MNRGKKPLNTLSSSTMSALYSTSICSQVRGSFFVLSLSLSFSFSPPPHHSCARRAIILMRANRTGSSFSRYSEPDDITSSALDGGAHETFSIRECMMCASNLPTPLQLRGKKLFIIHHTTRARPRLWWPSPYQAQSRCQATDCTIHVYIVGKRAVCSRVREPRAR